MTRTRLDERITAALALGLAGLFFFNVVFGPLAIGQLAHATGLGTAILTLLPLSLVVAVLAPALAGANRDPWE